MSEWGLLLFFVITGIFVVAILSDWKPDRKKYELDILKSLLESKNSLIKALRECIDAQDDLIASQRKYIATLKSMISRESGGDKE